MCYGCSDDDDNGYKTYDVSVQLVYPEGSELSAIEGLTVKLTSSSGTSYDATSNAAGVATFNVPAGIYEASASDKRSFDGSVYLYNGIRSNIVVTNLWTGEDVLKLNFTESRAGQVVIKELYVGGCQDNDGNKVFQIDKYVVLYNNSDLVAELENLCLGATTPFNSNSANKDYDAEGNLAYENAGWIPAGHGIWYLSSKLTIAPYSQVVIALNGAIDHTPTYTNSVNLANEKYYCTYDIEQYHLTNYYPTPFEGIPTDHYFSAVRYGLGGAWAALSTTSPAFFIFKIEGTTPVAFAKDPDNVSYPGEEEVSSHIRRKVPVEWVLDAVEVFTTDPGNNNPNRKRLSSVVDGGYVFLANKYGYTSYRNVDKEATEAIEGNAELLVYGYNKGTIYPDGTVTTDPSGIDAEASLKAGAKIIYKDTNNSTNDFHQRSQASLKD
nr:DUF4876 domain-containing protein [Bacteroides sp. 224]